MHPYEEDCMDSLVRFGDILFTGIRTSLGFQIRYRHYNNGSIADGVCG